MQAIPVSIGAGLGTGGDGPMKVSLGPLNGIGLGSGPPATTNAENSRAYDRRPSGFYLDDGAMPLTGLVPQKLQPMQAPPVSNIKQNEKGSTERKMSLVPLNIKASDDTMLVKPTLVKQDSVKRVKNSEFDDILNEDGKANWDRVDKLDKSSTSLPPGTPSGPQEFFSHKQQLNNLDPPPNLKTRRDSNAPVRLNSQSSIGSVGSEDSFRHGAKIIPEAVEVYMSPKVIKVKSTPSGLAMEKIKNDALQGPADGGVSGEFCLRKNSVLTDIETCTFEDLSTKRAFDQATHVTARNRKTRAKPATPRLSLASPIQFTVPGQPSHTPHLLHPSPKGHSRSAPPTMDLDTHEQAPFAMVSPMVSAPRSSSPATRGSARRPLPPAGGAAPRLPRCSSMPAQPLPTGGGARKASLRRKPSLGEVLDPLFPAGATSPKLPLSLQPLLEGDATGAGAGAGGPPTVPPVVSARKGTVSLQPMPLEVVCRHAGARALSGLGADEGPAGAAAPPSGAGGGGGAGALLRKGSCVLPSLPRTLGGQGMG